MPGFMPGIHVLTAAQQAKTWMAGTSPAMTENAHPVILQRDRAVFQRTTPEMQHGLRRGGLIWLLRKQRGAAPP